MIARSQVLLSLVVAGCAALALDACSTPTSRPQGGPTRPTDATPSPDGAVAFERAALLSAIGECAVTTYGTFRDRASKLSTAIDAAAADPTDDKRTAARAAWADAIAVWQEVEVMQIGPLAPTASPGGAALRDPIYGWPLFGRCLIDQVTVSKQYEGPTFTQTAFPNERGLGTLEYLLVHDGADNGCSAASAINTNGSWTAIAPELVSRRLAYAKVLGADVAQKAGALVDAWAEDKGKFLVEFRTAGKGSTAFPSEQAALNAASDAIFYLETMVKDQKLATPLGLTADCAGTPCPDRLESPFAKRSKEHLRANLIGFRKLFEGCGDGYAGLGFDDLLVSVGAGSVAEEMKKDLDLAFAALDAYPYPSFAEGLTKDPAAVRKVYDAVKELTDVLKTEFLGVLDLKIPKGAAGDAD
jgi:predicted lipoprotein